ncbi:MAG: hypothetical protein WB384_04590 [Candidatus Sulfotelmatobacter sp.]
MQGKLDETKKLLKRAWQLKSGQHDLTSTRLLFVRLTVALLETQPTEKFVGQLKTLLALESLPDHADVMKVWDITYFIEHLQPKLSSGSADFLTALATVLNDRTKLPELEEFPAWREAKPLPIDGE